jgi:hypothetical protein
MNSTNTMDSGQVPMVIPRRDAQVSETPDPITQCERANPSACPAGEVCDLLIRRFAGQTQFALYTGCVAAANERAEGDPCNARLTSGEPYVAKDLKDPVFRDPCGPGLVCAPNRDVRGAFSCQKECSSGAIGDQPFGCEDPSALCIGTEIAEYCYKTDGCNVEKQTGCRAGEACYLVPSEDQKQLLGLCWAEAQMPTADGVPGCSPITCNAGSVCLGPVRMPISSWTDTNVMCRPICNGESGQAPSASSDEDAGVPSGLCNASSRCEPYSASGLLLSSIPAPPFGQCEAQ